LLWALLWALGKRPALGNIIGIYGLGTCTLGSSCAFKASGIFARPVFWQACLLAGFVSAAALAWKLGRAELWRRPWGGFALAFGLALAPSFLGRDSFDRYYLPVFPPLIAAGALVLDPRLPRVLPALAALAAWSILGTWDYLAWNRAKNEAGFRLHATGIPLERISNGMDWDARYGYERRMEELLRSKAPRDIGPWEWWRESDYAAFVSFAPAARDPALERVGDVGYWTPLSGRAERVHMWRRRAAAPPGRQ
jgi:hypothetical protein